MVTRTLVRSTVGAAAYLRRRAEQLAQQAARRGGVVTRICDVFLLRAAGDKEARRGTTTVVELPVHLIGAFGGRDGAANYFTPALLCQYGYLLDALLRRTPTSEPTIAPGRLRGYLPIGDGRVVIGTVPAWGSHRNALNDTVGAVGWSPWAALVMVTPHTATPVPGDPEYRTPRTVFLCRSHARIVGPETNADGTVVVVEGQEPILPGHPAVRGGDPVRDPAYIGAVEFGADALVAASEYISGSGPCLEWSPLVGAFAIKTMREVGGNAFARVRLVRYDLTDNGVTATPRYTGTVTWNVSVDADTLPDTPQALSAVSQPIPIAPAADGWNIPPWAELHCLPGGRAAAAGVTFFDRDLSATCRLWSPPGAPSTLLGLLEVRNSSDDPTVVTVRGYKLDGTGGLLFQDIPLRAAAGSRWLSYLVAIDPSGTPTFVKLADFVDHRYDTTGALVRHQYQAFGGVLAADGTPRLVATRWAVPYEVRPAEADGPAPWYEQGEPARRVPRDSEYVRLTDLSLRLLSANGGQTVVSTPGYFPALGENDTSVAGNGGPGQPADGRQKFGDSAFRIRAVRTGKDFPRPFCQFGPGLMAIALHPVAAFTANRWPLFIGVVDVASGVLLHVVSTGRLTNYNSYVTLTCTEQCTVVGNDITAYGDLLITVGAVVAEADGAFVFRGMSTLSWVTTEPSNTQLAYAGNALVHATLGETANLPCSAPSPVA